MLFNKVYLSYIKYMIKLLTACCLFHLFSWVTHIISKLDQYGLVPGMHQAITWTSDYFNGTSRNKLQWICNQRGNYCLLQKWVWKYHLQNEGHFISGSMCRLHLASNVRWYYIKCVTEFCWSMCLNDNIPPKLVNHILCAHHKITRVRGPDGCFTCSYHCPVTMRSMPH